ncbi:hypothetical protein E4U26_000891 [Claviceps purpurea]|nr:hypothetical protein E4U26_000891 [Claviceps purpurea]
MALIKAQAPIAPFVYHLSPNIRLLAFLDSGVHASHIPVLELTQNKCPARARREMQPSPAHRPRDRRPSNDYEPSTLTISNYDITPGATAQRVPVGGTH